jgi:hypothetical protein
VKDFEQFSFRAVIKRRSLCRFDGFQRDDFNEVCVLKRFFKLARRTPQLKC